MQLRGVRPCVLQAPWRWRCTQCDSSFTCRFTCRFTCVTCFFLLFLAALLTALLAALLAAMRATGDLALHAMRQQADLTAASRSAALLCFTS